MRTAVVRVNMLEDIDIELDDETRKVSIGTRFVDVEVDYDHINELISGLSVAKQLVELQEKLHDETK